MNKLKQASGYIKLALMSLIVVAVFGAGAATAVGVGREAAGNSSKFDAVEVAHPQDTKDAICTNSTTFTDIPGMTKIFRTGGLFAGPSPAIVAFQAQYAGPSHVFYNLGSVRLVVDGVVQEGSGAELSLGGPNGPTAMGRSWNFFTGPLSPGNHTAAIQWKTVPPLEPNDPTGTQLCVQNRSMVIWHN